VHACFFWFIIGVYGMASIGLVMGSGVVWYDLLGSFLMMVDNGDWCDGAGVGRYLLIFISGGNI